MWRCIRRSLRVTKPRKKQTQYDQELLNWRKEMKATIDKYRNEFWELQTQVENDRITEFNQKELERLEHEATRKRHTALKLSKYAREMIEFKEEKKKKRDSKRMILAQDWAQKNQSRTLLINTLNLDSETWINKDNLDEKVKDRLFVPENIDYTDYYSKLRQESYLSLEGLPKSSYDHFNNRKETQFRNAFLSTLYSDIKSFIKDLTFSAEQKLFEDYEATKFYLMDNPQELKEVQQKYKLILASARAKESKDLNMFLQKSHKQLSTLANLVSRWNSYVDVLKMDDHEVMLYAAEEQMKSGELPEMFGEQEEAFEGDMQEPNPEFSEELPEEAINRENFAEEMEAKESFSGQLDVQKLFEESEGGASELDIYSGVSFEKETTPLEAKTALDQVLAEMNAEVSRPEDLYEINKVPGVEFNQEKEGVYNPAISLETFKQKTLSIDDQDLNLQSRWKKAEILRLIDKLNSIPVQEPHMLLKIFNHHRYDPPVFN